MTEFGNIDRKAEENLRAIYAAVVAAKRDDFDRSMKKIPAADLSYTVALAVAVDRAALVDINRGDTSDERIDYLVKSLEETETWYSPSQFPVKDFLRWLSDKGEPLEADATGVLSFLVGGWLLAAFLQGEEGSWYEYLDEILNRLDPDFAIHS